MITPTSSHRKHSSNKPNNQQTQIEIWTEFWRVLPAGPFYINQNKYRCINASSDWRAGEMEISEYQILSREENISQYGIFDNFPVNISDLWDKQWLLHQVSDCAV